MTSLATRSYPHFSWGCQRALCCSHKGSILDGQPSVQCRGTCEEAVVKLLLHISDVSKCEYIVLLTFQQSTDSQTLSAQPTQCASIPHEALSESHNHCSHMGPVFRRRQYMLHPTF